MNNISKSFLESSKAHQLDDIYSSYSEEKGFEKVLLKYKIQSIRPHLYGKSLLDVGCGLGLMSFAFAQHFDTVIGIDGSPKKIRKAKLHNSYDNVNFLQTMFESFNPDEHFDTIIATNVLEHVKYTVAFLKRLREMLSLKGRIIITVPNALGLHKRIGKQLGLISDFYVPTPSYLEKGHCHIYDRQRLIDDLKAASLHIFLIEGILLKPLSHKQMESWDLKICDALYEIGKELPDYCSSLMVVCGRK